MPRYHPPAKGYGQTNQAWVNAETLRRIDLPSRIKCGRCGKEKSPDNFSEKQKKDMKLAVHRFGSGAKFIGAKCMICSGAPPTEMECHMCHEAKDLEHFSNTQRRNVEKPKCRKCMDEQVAYDPANPLLPFDVRYDERFGHHSATFDQDDSWFYGDPETGIETASTSSSMGRTEEYESLSEDTDLEDTMSKVGFGDDDSDNDTVTGTQSPVILDRESYNQEITNDFVRGANSSRGAPSSIHGSSGFYSSTSGRSGVSQNTGSSVSNKLKADGWQFDEEDEEDEDDEDDEEEGNEEVTYQGRGGQNMSQPLSSNDSVSFPQSSYGRPAQSVNMSQFGNSADTVVESMSNISFVSSTAPRTSTMTDQRSSANSRINPRASGNSTTQGPHKNGGGDWIF